MMTITTTNLIRLLTRQRDRHIAGSTQYAMYDGWIMWMREARACGYDPSDHPSYPTMVQYATNRGGA
jgi:hypothetical protein